MGRSQKRRALRTSLRLEALERRELFASDVRVLSTGETLVEASILNWQISPYRNGWATPSEKLETSSSETEFDAQLKGLVGQYWQDVFGKQPNELIPKVTPVDWVFLSNDAALRSELIVANPVSSNQLLENSLDSTRSITTTRHDNIDEIDTSDMTDDGYLYTVVGESVHVANLRDPSQISVAAVISVQSYAVQLFVTGDSLLVMEGVIDMSPSLFSGDQYRQQTHFTLYDISQRMSPRVVSTTVLEGSNLAARLSKGQLTLVQSSSTNLPEPALVTDGSGVQRYESLDSYYTTSRNAIVAALQPDYSHTASGQAAGAFSEPGTWDDLSFANDSINLSTTLLRFELSATELTLIDSETITGLNSPIVYQGQEDIYLVSTGNWNANGTQSFIYKVDATSAGQFNTLGVVAIDGIVRDTTWLNEHAGILQVASSGNRVTMTTESELARTIFTDRFLFFEVPTDVSSANISTIGDTPDGWKVIGTLKDIGDGQGLLAANFIGNRAVITTGTPMIIDPLHGIDLSNPAQPVELSELTIPGFTTYLKQVDETHWLGFGYEQNVNSRQSKIQVSLYQVADLANPVLVDTWKSSHENWALGRNWDPHAISFDPATGLLVMTNSQDLANGSFGRIPVLKVDVNSDDALREIGYANVNESLIRGFTLDNILVAVAGNGITTFDVSDLSKKLGFAYLENFNSLKYISWSVTAGATQEWQLSSQWSGEPFVITNIETSGPITATLKADQSTITLSAPADAKGVSQEIKLTLQFESGHTLVAQGYLYSYAAVNEPVYSDDRASISAQFTDDAGNVVTELSSGDEVWVNVSVTDQRGNPAGVFGAYVDVTFDSGNVTVISQLEFTDFDNGRTGTISSSGVEDFGGFDGPSLPSTGTSQLGRFKIRIDNEKPVLINITPATGVGQELLLYNASRGVNPVNIEPAVLTTQSETMRTLVNLGNQRQDVNSDGVITPLDALLVVNYINARTTAAAESLSTVALNSTSSSFDISGDGIVSAVDVLQIVNTLNERNTSAASGEAIDLDTVRLTAKRA